MRSISRNTRLFALAAGIVALGVARTCVGGVRSEKWAQSDLWLTDYHRGTLSRFEVAQVLANCP